MAIVIGCSGSTGSSLLKTILNRHTHIFAGPEAGLFAFPQLFEDWKRYKDLMLTKQLKTDGWQMRYGMALLQPAFGWEKADLLTLISESSSFDNFIQGFFQQILQKTQKKIWVAKTPANAMGMAAFLEHFPKGKAVQTIRNPYDTIASLVGRGMNVYQATGYYVYNTAIASSNKDHKRYYQLKYEDLVAAPETTLVQLFNFLEIPFDAAILVAQHEKRVEPTAMKGWKHEETAAIATSSVGRFQEMSKKQQALIQTTFASFSIRKSFQHRLQIKFNTGRQLCEALDYEFLPVNNNQHRLLLNTYKWKDQIGRIKHGYWKQFFNYMGEII